MSENCIILFIKDPNTVQVKSRLLEKLDKQLVIELYKAFVLDLVLLLKNLNFNFKIAFYPPEAAENVKSWLGDSYNYLSQRGNDLGEKVKNSFADIFHEGFSNALLIGSDSPDLTIEIFQEAFTSLEKADSVIGPALDGGYYLIGFRREKFLSEIFQNMEWSTSSVFHKTINIFHKHNYNVHKLPEWLDIDTYDDLKALVESSQNNDFSESETISFLKNNPIFQLR